MVVAVVGQHPTVEVDGLDVGIIDLDPLANNGDELLLLTPWGAPTGRLSWGHVPSGVSPKRTGFSDADIWVTAYAVWPSSVGDLGSPGAAYTPPPSPATRASG